MRPLTDSSSISRLLIRALFMQDRLSVIVTGPASQYAHMAASRREWSGVGSGCDVRRALIIQSAPS